jgi:hypothetical protein
MTYEEKVVHQKRCVYLDEVGLLHEAHHTVKVEHSTTVKHVNGVIQLN